MEKRSMAEVELVCLDPRRVREIFPLVAARLARALQRTCLSHFAAVQSEISCGQTLLWLAFSKDSGSVIIEAVAATKLELTDAGKVCVITACEGKGMSRWLSCIDEIEAYAKAEGCRRVRIFGRKGWLRALEGYRQRHVIIEKTID